jgi:hypothetical protein
MMTRAHHSPGRKASAAAGLERELKFVADPKTSTPSFRMQDNSLHQHAADKKLTPSCAISYVCC